MSFFPTQLIHAQESHYNFHFSSIEKLIEQEIGRAVLPHIYQSIGLNIKVSPMPANRAEMMATSGALDGEIMRIWTYGIENPTTLRVPTPYYQLETMPFTLSNKNIVIRNKDDLKKYRVAIVRGVKHTQNITQNLTMIYQSSNTENMFKLLKTEQVDVVLTNTIDGQVVLKKLGYDDIIPMKKPIARLALFHYIHEKNQALVPRIDKAIKDLKTSGKLDDLLDAAESTIINAQPN